MEINRDKVYAGLICKKRILSSSHPRKIVFYHDEKNNIGYDLINDMVYSINKPEKKHDFFINNQIKLNSILLDIGYPEVLSNIDIQKMFNEDFKTIFMESGILDQLYYYSMEELLPSFYGNYTEILKNGFNITSEEVKVLQKKRRF